MIYRVLADAVVLLHFAFVSFVVLGALLVRRWRRAAWVHVPAAVWGILVEMLGWECPLTPLEDWLRMKGGGAADGSGSVDRYIAAILYPTGLTRGTQVALGGFLLAVNIIAYAKFLRGPVRRGTSGPFARGVRQRRQ